MDLFSIKQALQSKLTGDSQFSFLNTRLILRTGVDLSRVQSPGLATERAGSDRSVVVLKTLREFGYDLRPEVR